MWLSAPGGVLLVEETDVSPLLGPSNRLIGIFADSFSSSFVEQEHGRRTATLSIDLREVQLDTIVAKR